MATAGRSIACLTVLLLGGCTGAGQGSEYCALARPILVGRADALTQRTAEAVLKHNEAWAATCAR